MRERKTPRFRISAMIMVWSLWHAASAVSFAGEPVHSVGDYRVFRAICATSDRPNRPLIILRRFLLDGKDEVFMVDPATFRTDIRPAAGLSIDPVPWGTISDRFAGTPYIKALRDAEANASVLQDAGITRFSSAQHGVDLTVDLCPSRLPLDRVIFTELVKDLGAVEKPVPLAVAVTGVWMDKHAGDLDWLIGLERSGAITVTWINHSFNHRTTLGLPLKENFLLEKGTDIDAEVLKTEVRMIERGLAPSVFFRFPGLVSDKALVAAITETYSLVPIGSDAWLAKNERPKAGSIVLVHANGNEPLGIRRFLGLLRDEKADIAGKRWLLYDLRESAVELEK
jgi:hypothetical protein